MQPSPDLERQRFQRFPNGRGAANPACGTVERSKEAIADGVEFPSTKADDLTAYRAVVLIEEFAPAAVPEVRCALGGADDVHVHLEYRDRGSGTCGEAGPRGPPFGVAFLRPRRNDVAHLAPARPPPF